MNQKTSRLIRQATRPLGLIGDARRRQLQESKAEWNSMPPRRRALVRRDMVVAVEDAE